MRILYVTLDRGIPLGGTKGASVHLEEFLRALEAAGHETAVVARATAGGDERRVFAATVPERFGWVPGRALRRDLRELRAAAWLRSTLRHALAEFFPDIVYERYALFRTEALEECRLGDVPLVLEVNAPLVEEERRFRALRLGRWAARAERRSWVGADLVVVPSQQLADRVRARGQRRVLVVPNAVDPQRFASCGQGAAASLLRRRLGLEDRFVIGFVGSLKRWHDLDTILDAAAAVPEPRAALLVVGEGPERRRLERRAAENSLTAVFPGAVSHVDVPSYLASMDVCVAGLCSDPSLHYFSPLKALEYLAAGRPTVVADAGDLAALVRAGAALSYRPGEPASLAARLQELAANPQLRGRLGRAGRAYAESRTWCGAAEAILEKVSTLPLGLEQAQAAAR